jgi:hypothetical protein
MRILPTFAIKVKFPGVVQLSNALGVSNETVVVQFPVPSLLVLAFTSNGQAIVGVSLSITVTACVEVAVKPAVSVAVQVTLFSPLIKLAGEGVTVTVVQLSEALGGVNWELA